MFVIIQLFSIEKLWKLRFWPAFGVGSTQMLVKIYNTNLKFSITYFYADKT